MTNVMFDLLQICDSNFPSGAFSHSFGLETYIQEGTITNKDTFSSALKQYVATQFAYTDGLACRLAYEAIQQKEFSKVWQIDQELFALGRAKETREGNKRIGRQLVRVMNELYQIDLLKSYEVKIKAKELHGHSAIVFAIVCEDLQVDLTTALSVYLFASASTLVQNGVRGIPLGQTDGQKILRELQSVIEETIEKVIILTEDDFGAGALGLEIAQMMHEQLSVRLFMS